MAQNKRTVEKGGDDNLMICQNCEKEVQIIKTVKSKWLCEECLYELMPPVLVLTILSGEPGLLFNPKTGKFESNVEQMKKLCGFHLFSHKIFMPPHASLEKHKEIFTYRYRGTKRCGRFDTYQSWPTSMQKCDYYNTAACMNRLSARAY